MTEKEYNNNDKVITKSMLDEIDNNYKKMSLDIPEPIYDKNGKLKNEKEVKDKLKKILPVIMSLWVANIAITNDNSSKVMINTNTYINAFKSTLKLSKTMITTDEWDKIMVKLLKDRQSKIKIKQVIRGNANILNKQVQDIVNTMYKDGKSWVQTSKELQKQFGYNKNKAKSIAITEKNYYKSEAQLQAIDNISEQVNKIWIHNNLSKDPREPHIEANGQIADNNGYFHVGGFKTKSPQHFGIPSQDINCHCTMRIERK